jgi:hypothetical protein
MTVLEELIDVALKCCEKSRLSGLKFHNARGCALLTSSGKVISPLTFFFLNSFRSTAAVMSMLPKQTQILVEFHRIRSFLMLLPKKLRFWRQFQMDRRILRFFFFFCCCNFMPQHMIIASDTSEEFPVPDGQIREFLRSFGLFGIVLVNCHIEHR